MCVCVTTFCSWSEIYLDCVALSCLWTMIPLIQWTSLIESWHIEAAIKNIFIKVIGWNSGGWEPWEERCFPSKSRLSFSALLSLWMGVFSNELWHCHDFLLELNHQFITLSYDSEYAYSFQMLVQRLYLIWYFACALLQVHYNASLMSLFIFTFFLWF